MSAKIRIGIVGMGAAGWAFLPPIRANPAFELAAVAEPAVEMREAVAAETGVAVHPDLPSMLRNLWWRTRNLIRSQLRKGGWLYETFQTVRQPARLRLQFLYWMARARPAASSRRAWEPRA